MDTLIGWLALATVTYLAISCAVALTIGRIFRRATTLPEPAPVVRQEVAA